MHGDELGDVEILPPVFHEHGDDLTNSVPHVDARLRTFGGVPKINGLCGGEGENRCDVLAEFEHAQTIACRNRTHADFVLIV